MEDHMPRYIAIEHNSGFVWGDAFATTPETACTAIAHEAAGQNQPLQTWERVPPLHDPDGGFHLYVAPDDFPAVDDGQDQDLIAQVQAVCEHVGDYRPVKERLAP